MALDPRTTELLSILHRGGAFAYWWTMEGRQAFWWEVGRPTPLPGGRRNVYVGVHPTTIIPETNPRGEHKEPRELRAQLPIIAALNCLYTEYDAKDFGGDKTKARAAADAIAPAPSVLVDSGGGYHLYWLFGEPWVLHSDEDRQHAKRLQAAWVAYAGGDKAVKDLARVLRVPGTLNHKYQPPRPVQYVFACFERTYTRQELEVFCAHLMVDDRLMAAASQHTSSTVDESDSQVRYARTALDREVANVLRAPNGLKHDTIRNTAVKLGTLIARGLLNEQEVTEEIARAANLHRSDVADTYRTILDGIAYGKQRPRAIPPPAYTSTNGTTPNGQHAPTVANKDVWPNVLPLYTHESPLFPVDVFPSWLRAYIEAETESKQTPIDLACMLALAVLSTACARYVMIAGRSDWLEPVNLFVVVALPPASRKSPMFAAMTAPLELFERETVLAAKLDIAKAENQHTIIEAQLAEARREAAKAKGDMASRAALEKVDDLTETLVNFQVPVEPRLIVDDVTSERLAAHLVEQGGRIAALSPEGDIFSIMAGRYSADGGPNIGVYLRAHAGDPLRVDRRTRAEFIQRPALTMGLTVQPEVVRSFAKTQAFRGLGLLGRFLYALPKSTIGRRKIDPPPVDPAMRRAYFDYVTSLLRLCPILAANSEENGDIGEGTLNSEENGDIGVRYIENNNNNNNIYLLRLSDAANRIFVRFQEWLEPQLAEDGEFSLFTDWAGKLAGAVLRIAALLHMAEYISLHPHNPHNPQNSDRRVSELTMARSIAVAHYLVLHARSAFMEMGADPAVESARRIIGWLERKQPEVFTKRACYQDLKSVFKRASDLDPVLELLTDHGYVRPLDGDDRTGPGRRPSQQFEVNPAIYADVGEGGRSSIAFPFDYVPSDTPAAAQGYRAVSGYDEPADELSSLPDDYEEL